MKIAKHSKLGIISFVLSLIPILFLAITALLHYLSEFGIASGSIANIIINKLLNLIFPVLLVAVMTGASGFFEENHKKTYVKIGLIIASIQLLVIATIWIWAEIQHFS